jgi:release factor glutamine methyltransferase
MGSPTTYADVVGALRAAGCVFAEDEADLIVAAARTPQRLAAMVRDRSSGLPLEQVLGWAEFCGLRIVVRPGVFVPRRRTEWLAAEAIALASRVARRRPVVLDLCCGAGALASAVGAAVDAEVHAADVEPAAVECARLNLDGRGRVYEGDLFQPLPRSLRGRVDVLVANVPYVPTDEIALLPAEARLHEPRVTLDGGVDGLDVARRVAEAAPAWLAPGGSLLIETSERQVPTATGVLEAVGLRVRVLVSDELEATVVVGSAAEAG